MDKLQKLIDIEEIKNLKHRYFRAIDMADFDLLDNVFSPDISIDYRGGTYRWESEGKETIKESLAKLSLIVSLPSDSLSLIHI